MKYLFDRLREPGTMRSLIWVLLSIAGQTVTEDTVASMSLLAVAGLGVVSALMPEKKVVDAGVAAEAVKTVAEASVQTSGLVAEARGVLASVAQKLR